MSKKNSNFVPKIDTEQFNSTETLYMTRKRRNLFLSLLLCCVAGVMAQTTPSLVPAMIVYGTDGNKQVVRLEGTNVTELIMQETGQSLSLAIPEAQLSGIRAIVFAMVEAQETQTPIENTETPLVKGVEKIMRDGQVVIRLQMHDDSIIEYDVRGNKVANKE